MRNLLLWVILLSFLLSWCSTNFSEIESSKNKQKRMLYVMPMVWMWDEWYENKWEFDLISDCEKRAIKFSEDSEYWSAWFKYFCWLSYLDIKPKLFEDIICKDKGKENILSNDYWDNNTKFNDIIEQEWTVEDNSNKKSLSDKPSLPILIPNYRIEHNEPKKIDINLSNDEFCKSQWTKYQSDLTAYNACNQENYNNESLVNQQYNIDMQEYNSCKLRNSLWESNFCSMPIKKFLNNKYCNLPSKPICSF